MKLQDALPDGVTVDGRFYRLDFDFRNVLRMIEYLGRDDLMQEAREYNAIRCLTKRPRNVSKVLDAVRALLFQKTPENDAKKVTDFIQDAGLIRAAFWQAYRINLYRDRLHWFAFTELLHALPDETRYSYVVSIRARPMPVATKWNAEERQWLIKAKASVALEMTEDEQKSRYQKDVANIAHALLAWAGEKNE